MKIKISEKYLWAWKYFLISKVVELTEPVG